jgi:hypothetical protein
MVIVLLVGPPACSARPERGQRNQTDEQPFDVRGATPILFGALFLIGLVAPLRCIPPS